MATYDYATKAAAIITRYQALVDALDDGQVKDQADFALADYGNALLAYANISASAASNYANGVGISVTKVTIDTARAQMESTFSRFAAIMLAAEVTLESFGDDPVSFWDMSRNPR